MNTCSTIRWLVVMVLTVYTIFIVTSNLGVCGHYSGTCTTWLVCFSKYFLRVFLNPIILIATITTTFSLRLHFIMVWYIWCINWRDSLSRLRGRSKRFLWMWKCAVDFVGRVDSTISSFVFFHVWIGGYIRWMEANWWIGLLRILLRTVANHCRLVLPMRCLVKILFGLWALLGQRLLRIKVDCVIDLRVHTFTELQIKIGLGLDRVDTLIDILAI